MALFSFSPSVVSHRLQVVLRKHLLHSLQRRKRRKQSETAAAEGGGGEARSDGGGGGGGRCSGGKRRRLQKNKDSSGGGGSKRRRAAPSEAAEAAAEAPPPLPPNERLLLAAARGDIAELRTALDSAGAELDHQAPGTGETALLAACRAGAHEAVGELLARGADAYLYAADGATPMLLAARAGSAACLRLLNAAGADAFALAPDTLRTPLLEAAAAGAAECIQVLADDCGVPVREEFVPEESETGEHALLLAAAAGHAGAIEALLARGAKVNRVDKRGRSALWAAAHAGHADAVRALRAARPPPKQIADFVDRLPPIKVAAREGHRGVVELLAAALARGFSDGGGGGGGARQGKGGGGGGSRGTAKGG